MAEKSQNAVSGKEKKIIKNNKEKTIQQQKGLPTLSADLKNIGACTPKNCRKTLLFRSFLPEVHYATGNDTLSHII